jgi:hypothetical protein
VELLHAHPKLLLRILYLPKPLLQLLDLLGPRFVELLLLLPRGGRLPSDVVEIVFAVLGEFGVFELPALG